MADNLETILARAPVIPVMVIERLEDAVPLATALHRGGLSVLEITLRTPAALDSLRAIKRALPDARVGAGTVVSAQDVERAADAGADFLVSPGSTTALSEAAEASGLPLLPGVSSVSEAMALLERGIHHMKFFPAEAAGGVAWLKSVHGPLPQLTFCPTGGITPEKAREYLALPNVVCVGGSWMVPAKLIAGGDWAGIEALAREAAALRQSAETR